MIDCLKNDMIKWLMPADQRPHRSKNTCDFILL